MIAVLCSVASVMSESLWPQGYSLPGSSVHGILQARGEGDDRGWDGWIASLTWWTLVWVDSRSWWWTARPGVLWFMESQKAGHDWVTELNWTEYWNGLAFPSPGDLPDLGIKLRSPALQADSFMLRHWGSSAHHVSLQIHSGCQFSLSLPSLWILFHYIAKKYI